MRTTGTAERDDLLLDAAHVSEVPTCRVDRAHRADRI